MRHFKLDSIRAPDELLSPKTPIYLGYCKGAAFEMWEDWEEYKTLPGMSTGVPQENILKCARNNRIVSFYDVIIKRVSHEQDGIDTVSEDDEAWVRMWDFWGMSDELEDAILDRRFRDIRLSQSWRYWTRDSMNMRYRGLRAILANKNGTSNQAVLADLRLQIPGLNVFDTLGDLRSWADFRDMETLVLWRCVDAPQITGLLDKDGGLRNLSVLAGANDFNDELAYSFTPNYRLAECQAAWAKRRALNETIVLIRMELPIKSSRILREKQTVVRLQQEWSELVWHRLRKKPLPAHLQKHKDATLIVGTMARGPVMRYQDVASPMDIGPEYAFCLPETQTPAAGMKPHGETQFVFQGSRGGAFLEEHLSKIETAVFTTNHLELWKQL